MRRFSLRSLLLSIAAMSVCCGLLRVAATTEDSALRLVLVWLALAGFGGIIGAYFDDVLAGVAYMLAVIIGLLMLAMGAIIACVVFF